MTEKGGKVLVAMSGGVDSSAAALLLKQQGFEVEGASMRLLDDSVSESASSGISDAEAAAKRLGIPFHVFDCRAEFRREVIQNFISVYKNGATPNPCIVCNRKLKFGLFLDRALELGFDFIATGHYAVTGFENGRHTLSKGADKSKDQSYVLYGMTQKQLAHTLFPLGKLTKTEVRALAEASGLLNARKSESQDICFVPDGKYAEFIEKETGEKNLPGNFVDAKGKILGIHKGMINYTTGQRKHLGISLPPEAETLYVCGKNAKTNTVLLGTGKQLERKELTANECNLIAYDIISEPLRCCAKFRYRQPEQPVTVEQTGEASLKITFDAPQRGIAPGQSVVLYDGERVLGGGIIE